jgi:hypothetical protein
MTIRTVFGLAVSMVALSSCTLATAPGVYTTPKEPFTPKQTFSAEEVAWAKQPGTNTIEGSALLRQQGGGVVTCGGSEVDLIPASKYASERLTYLYGGPDGGYTSALSMMYYKEPPPPNPEYQRTWRKTICDAQGKFKFTNLPDGGWYVLSEVRWTVNTPQGGYIAKFVQVKDGETKEVVLTAN